MLSGFSNGARVSKQEAFLFLFCRCLLQLGAVCRESRLLGVACSEFDRFGANCYVYLNLLTSSICLGLGL